MENNFKGETSEWNEGDYKNLRLHKAQEIINASTLNPLGHMNLFGINKLGYRFWFDGIDMLFGEGMSKYSSDEVKDIEKLREDVEKLIESNPASKNFMNWKGEKGKSIHYNNWIEIKKKLREFEYKVKKYNDQHGLSTRNKDEDEGL